MAGLCEVLAGAPEITEVRWHFDRIFKPPRRTSGSPSREADRPPSRVERPL